ncbi:MAG: AMP-binding protein [Clostridiales bacterium]|jgi:fatty-acyl-CoA synthase|nr:AMP-binding protein [Clostridiales bacterium]
MDKLWEITLGGLIDYMAEKFPNNDCVVYTDRPFRTTYSQFRRLVDETAKGLMSIGVTKGSHVSIWATNYPEWILTMFATAKLGAVMITVNTNYKIYEAEYLLRQSDTDTLILINGFKDSDYLEAINELVPDLAASSPGQWQSVRLPRLKNIIYIESGPSAPLGMYNWSQLAEFAKNVPDWRLAEAQAATGIHDVVNMQYTSGTTGFPKGVMLTHYNIVNDGFFIGESMRLTHRDRMCIPVPFFHCFGCVLGIMAGITHGSTLVPVEHFNPLRVMGAVQEERCTALHGVPTMFITIMSHPDFITYDLSSLRTGIMAGSPCPIKVMRQAVDEMHMREITIAYGLTEASPVCTQTTTEDTIERRVTTVGRSLPFMECKVVDPATGEDCPEDVPGEFVVRGFNIMKGYYNMPEATAQVIVDGWLHSGDMAARDKDGYYKITGRIKDMIIRGGENIYPKEVEDFLYTHPQVSDVQVVGVPSREYGEEVCACIILKKGGEAAPLPDDFKNFVRQNMARHKVPRYVIFLDAFPLTASGKVQKYRLREDAAALLGLAEE